MLETFTRETFAPHLGETFRLGLDGGSDLELALIETTDLSQPGASAVWRAGAGGRGQARAKRPCGFSTVSRRTVASSTPAARRAGRKSVSR